MKKYTSIFRVLVIFISAVTLAAPGLSACADTSSTSGTTTVPVSTTTTSAVLSGNMTWDDLSVEIDGHIYTLLGEASGLIEKMGEPDAYYEAPSCLYEGTDNTYEYEDMILYTITKDGKELIDGIDLITGSYQTRRGIKAGSTVQDILDAYGDPFSEDANLVYITDPSLGDVSPRITFVVSDGSASMVSIYSGSNSIAE